MKAPASATAVAAGEHAKLTAAWGAGAEASCAMATRVPKKSWGVASNAAGAW